MRQGALSVEETKTILYLFNTEDFNMKIMSPLYGACGYIAKCAQPLDRGTFEEYDWAGAPSS